jgi:hypothetical protein
MGVWCGGVGCGRVNAFSAVLKEGGGRGAGI